MAIHNKTSTLVEYVLSMKDGRGRSLITWPTSAFPHRRTTASFLWWGVKEIVLCYEADNSVIVTYTVADPQGKCITRTVPPPSLLGSKRETMDDPPLKGIREREKKKKRPVQTTRGWWRNNRRERGERQVLGSRKRRRPKSNCLRHCLSRVSLLRINKQRSRRTLIR